MLAPAGDRQRSPHRKSAQSSMRFVRGRQVWNRTRSLRVIAWITGLVLFLAVGILLVPPAGETQQVATIPRIGFLSPSSLDAPTSRLIGAFREGLRELG